MCETSYHFDDNPAFVADYERMPRMFVPAYDASQIMATTLLQLALPDQAELLVIGAGGGVEMARFAAASPDWCFTAVDPSVDMLAQAKARMQHEAHAHAVQYHQGVSLDAPHGPFDAATAFLSLIFVPDDGQRLEQLCAIHQRLKPGAPFVMIDGASDKIGTATFEKGLERYIRHAELNGATPDLIDVAVSWQRSAVDYVTPQRSEALLAEAGFRDVELFFKAFWVEGRICAA